MTPAWRWGLGAVLPALLAAAAIVATYDPLSQTWDEAAHLAAGIELLDRGSYTLEPQHPPLARLAAAALPYLDGMRSPGASTYIFTEGNALLESAPDYDRALSLARLGLLPFFLLLLAASWFWARRIAGPAVAAAAVLLLATLPPLVGNAGLATTDVASVATLTLAFLALMRWLDRPTWPAAFFLGIAAALALATKFSAIPFLGLTLVTWVALRWWAGGPARPALPLPWRQIAAMPVAFLLVLWAVYGFGRVPLLDPANAPYEAVDALFGTSGVLHDLAYAVGQAPVYPRFVESIARGIQSVAQHNAGGHVSYLLGETRQFGWWYYYPVAIAVRTPLPLLLLGLGGFAWMTLDGVRQRDWRRLAPAAASIVLLVFLCGVSNINIGLRHAFVLYPPLAIAGGYAAWRLAQINWPARIVAALLLLAQAGSAVLAHPDHLAYFNLLARGAPERILLDADLDWGQDLKRLAAAVRARGIERIAVAYNGSADPARFVPGFELLPPNRPTTGWLAVSVYLLVDESCGSYRWLEDYAPVARIGRSIRLYRVEALKPETLADPRHRPSDLTIGRCRRLMGLG